MKTMMDTSIFEQVVIQTQQTCFSGTKISPGYCKTQEWGNMTKLLIAENHISIILIPLVVDLSS